MPFVRASPHNFEGIVFEHNEEGIARITLNNPRALNPISVPIVEEIRHVIREIAVKDNIKVLIITGSGRGFCSGANLSAMDETVGSLPSQASANLRSHFNAMIVEMQNLEKLIIAQVNGIAAGGGFSLAMAADFRICSTNASFLSAFIRIGLVPDIGLSYFLPRVVGTTRAMEIMTLGEVIPPQKALDWGIVNKVVSPESLEEEVIALATRLLQGPVAARGWTKRLIANADGQLANALENEARYQGLAAGTRYFKEAIKRFAKPKL